MAYQKCSHHDTFKSVKKLSVMTGNPKMTTSDSIRRNPISITLFDYARSLFNTEFVLSTKFPAI